MISMLLPSRSHGSISERGNQFCIQDHSLQPLQDKKTTGRRGQQCRPSSPSYRTTTTYHVPGLRAPDTFLGIHFISGFTSVTERQMRGGNNMFLE